MFKQQFLQTKIYPENKNIGDAPKKMIIFLHGLGSNGDDLISLAPYMASELRDFIFLSPNGIELCDMSPFGYQWFSLQDRDPEVLYKKLEEITPQLNDYIDSKLEEYKLSSEDLFLVGFSQGTMTALHVALHRKNKIAGVVGFSGSFILASKMPVELNQLPVCLIHGMYDDVVPFTRMNEAVIALEKYNIAAKSYAIANLTHSINAQGIKYAVNFIKDSALMSN